MQIHDLNTKALTDPAYVAFDDGTDTYKTEFNDVVADAAAAAVADADLTDNTVAFTSGDSASPTEWTAVDVLTSGLSLKTLFNRISTMIKNVRYIWSKIGTASMGTTATTITGAIAEHETDISELNSKINRSTLSNTTINASNLEIPITNYTQYAFFVMEVSAQSWIDTYIWSTYAATKNVQFGYNNGSSARCDFSTSGFKFSNLSLASGISSFKVRVIGVKIPAD